MERAPLFILIDTDTEGLTPFYDHVNELDDKQIYGFEAINEYKPNGTFHIVDTFEDLKDASRWKQLYLATLGARVWTNIDEKDKFNYSPLFAGAIPDESKIRKVAVDATFAEGRAGLYSQYGVNYLGRTKLDPRNIFVFDNKKGNYTHDPDKDPLLEALYDSLPEDWWGSCAFVSSGNINKLEAFFNAFPDVIPLTWTTGGMAKLKFFGLDYVHAAIPNGTERWGLDVRDAANRLSYKLSLTPEERAALNQ